MVERLRKRYASLSLQVRASFWFLVCSVLQKGISVITTPIFTRLLTTQEYGQYNVFNSWLAIVSVFVTLNMHAGVYTMGLVKFKEEARVFSSSLQGLSFTLCAIWTAIYVVTKDFWNGLFQLTTVQMLCMFVMIWATHAFTFWMTEQRNEFRYRALVAATLVVSALKPIVGIVFVLHAEDKVTARILGLALVELVGYIGFFIVQMKRGKVFYSAKYWKYAVVFNLPLVPHYLSNVILGSSDRIMIQRLVGESAAGIYSLAYSLGQLMNMVNDALNKTMSPWIYQRIREEEYADIHRVVYPSIACVGLANMLLIVIAPEIVMVFAPPEYYEAIYTIVPVAINGVFTYMYLCFAPFEFYFEKRAWTTTATLVSAVTNIVLNFALIPVFGYIAAGYTTLACSMLNAVMHMYFMRRVCDDFLDGARPYDTRFLVMMSGGFVLAGMLFIPTYGFPLVRYGMLIAAMGVALVKRRELVAFVKTAMGK